MMSAKCLYQFGYCPSTHPFNLVVTADDEFPVIESTAVTSARIDKPSPIEGAGYRSQR